MKIIPAIDIIDGKCVRLTQGDYTKSKVYNENPLEVAKNFEAAGLKYLHLVDLDGARLRKVKNLAVLEEITSKTSLIVDFGGGIEANEDIKSIFDAGACQINIGSVAVRNSEKMLDWMSIFGSDKLILGADCKERKIASAGWLESSDQYVLSFIAYFQSHGLKHVVCTDISKDGMLQGPSVELYSDILAQTRVSLIASGGISCINDLVALDKIGCSGAIVGKAIYEDKISIEELSELQNTNA